jgi:hypothetical protein
MSRTVTTGGEVSIHENRRWCSPATERSSSAHTIPHDHRRDTQRFLLGVCDAHLVQGFDRAVLVGQEFLWGVLVEVAAVRAVAGFGLVGALVELP